jgi:hypothetical protein
MRRPANSPAQAAALLVAALLAPTAARADATTPPTPATILPVGVTGSGADAQLELALGWATSAFSHRVGAGLAWHDGAFVLGVDAALEARKTDGLPASEQTSWPRLGLRLGARPTFVEGAAADGALALALGAQLLGHAELAPISVEGLAPYTLSALAGLHADVRAADRVQLGVAASAVVDPTPLAANANDESAALGVDALFELRLGIALPTGWIGLVGALEVGVVGDARATQGLVRLTAAN